MLFLEIPVRGFLSPEVWPTCVTAEEFMARRTRLGNAGSFLNSRGNRSANVATATRPAKEFY